jgi:four helix bundle protein
MRNFKKLLIWQVGMQLVREVYKIVPDLPKEETFGMRIQMTRCVISIPTNIAEGSAKRSQKDYLRFVEISLASAFELETHALIVKEQNWVKLEAIDNLLALIEREQKMISKFIEKL